MKFSNVTYRRLLVTLLFLTTFAPVAEAKDSFETAKDYYFNKKFSIARALFLKTIEKNILNHEAHFYLANILTIEKKYERAAEHYRKALDLNPTASYYYSYASLLLFQKKFSEAEKYYKKALKLNPEKHTAEAQLADIYIKTWQYKKAVISLSNIIAIQPAHPHKNTILKLMADLSKNYEYAERMRSDVNFLDQGKTSMQTNLSLPDLFDLGDDSFGREEEIESKDEETIKDIDLDLDIVE